MFDQLKELELQKEEGKLFLNRLNLKNVSLILSILYVSMVLLPCINLWKYSRFDEIDEMLGYHILFLIVVILVILFKEYRKYRVMKMELEIKLIKKSRGILEEDISENKLDKKEDESESELEKKIGILNAKIDFITVSKTTKILTLIFYIILPIILLKLELSIEKILSIVLFISLIFFIIFFIKFKLNIKLKETEAKLKYLNLDKSELSSTQEEEFFKRLVEINFKYLDQYYLQTKEQADKSFMLVVIAGTIGLVIITLGIGLVYKKEETVGNIVTITGILIEFITAIFFYLYNKTLLKTGDYHKKLVLSQNVSLALKTTEDFDINEKFKLREKIILEITKDINQHLCK